ncbi:hypothetical protein [Mycolicibacterium holsaticum]|uniref:hypothetical protein n=1 Tax=Mycolicibacterium holsaticum TaxID=152142 RepID=UPI001C7CA5C4|nr:hypothetical protein [Mycolicibacterium holsaticum]MDA4108627.1 hypothetical protein [Mycolicibacterium holsaticum DSM 44478 = JCM 12374]QZA12648.1 hypothetical protein K3U96_26745 [Mycolicibacterium holsaticum DSM 44478 = JCM 12374]UNC09875.1 hypothetical protein H5U41_00060 [Mycolicibacterium holsaticum DSM 44478 = JCM 12374]
MDFNFVERMERLSNAVWKLTKRTPAVGFAIELWSGPTVEPFRIGSGAEPRSLRSFNTDYPISGVIAELPESDGDLGTPGSPWQGLEGYDSA